jgi:hypothetical protein
MSGRRISAEARTEVEGRFHGRCAYCQTQQQVVGSRLTVDHIIPKLLGGSDDRANLCLACWDCNLAKQGRISGRDPASGALVPLFRPDRDAWPTHFTWDEGGRRLIGLTPEGRATVSLLRLNRVTLVEARNRWIEAGWHPPPT